MTCENKKYSSGFSLLEMVLVLFILAIITTTSLSFIDNEDGQLRFQESMQKFDSIYTAMIDQRSSRGSSFLSGFIIDNGSLPDGTTDLSPLTSDDTDWSDDFGDKWVEYNDYRPYYYDVSDAERQIFDENRYKLSKGFRGPYIRNNLDSSNQLKDGWGKDFNVTTSTDTNFEFTFDATSEITQAPFSVNVANIAKIIDQNDWSILPASLNITVNNNDDGAGDITDENLRVAVVVFSNNPNDDSVATDDDDLWNTFYFDVTLSNSASTNSSSETWAIDGSAPNITRIPAGEHLVLLLDTDETAGTAAEIADYARVTAFPTTGNQPEIVLEFEP